MKRDDQVREALGLFDEYLELRGIREATRKSYVNATSKMIGEYCKNGGTLDEPAVTEYEASLARGSRNVFRVAWKHFRALCIEEGSPVPPEAKKTSLRAMRQDVADAVRFIASQMSVKQLSKQRWDGITTQNNRVTVLSPDQSAFLFVGESAVFAFQTLAIAYHDTVRPGRSYPLIPKQEGAMEGLSTASIRLLIKQGRPMKVADDIELPPEIVAYASTLLAQGVQPERILRAMGTVFLPTVVGYDRENPTPLDFQLELENSIEEEERERPKTQEQIDSEAIDKLLSERPKAAPIPTFAQWQKHKPTQS